MTIERVGFSPILPDNDVCYFSLLEGVVNSVDELSALTITRSGNRYLYRLIPSAPKYLNSLVEEITSLHNIFQLHLDFSKSIKTSSVLTFYLQLNN